METIFCVLFLILTLDSFLAWGHYSEDCPDICRNGCDHLTGFGNALCINKIYLCECYGSKDTGRKSVLNDDFRRNDEKVEWDANSDLYSGSTSKKNNSGFYVIAVVVVFIIILCLFHCCLKAQSTSDTTRPMPNVQVNMALQRPPHLGSRKMTLMRPGNGYLQQMHLAPIAPPQERGPVPGFLIPNCSPSYEPL